MLNSVKRNQLPGDVVVRAHFRATFTHYTEATARASNCPHNMGCCVRTLPPVIPDRGCERIRKP